MRVFNCDGTFGGERIDYDDFASAVFELFDGFWPVKGFRREIGYLCNC